MLGIRMDDALNKTTYDQGAQWDEAERKLLEANLTTRKPFLDFVYSRTDPNGSRQF